MNIKQEGISSIMTPLENFFKSIGVSGMILPVIFLGFVCFFILRDKRSTNNMNIRKILIVLVLICAVIIAVYEQITMTT